MRNTCMVSVLLFLCSCNQHDSKNDITKEDTTFINVDSGKPSAEDPIQFQNLIWLPLFDSLKGNVVLKQQRQVIPDTLTADKLIKEINASWDGIRLEFRKISHDTIYVALPESTVLTQQMGSNGAYSYMSSTTYILTELKHINFVNYDFLEGDHWAPGTMKRADFKK